MLFIILLINIPTLTAHTSTVQLGNKRAAFPGRTKDGRVINFVSTAELKLLDRVSPILSFTVNLKALYFRLYCRCLIRHYVKTII